MVVFFVIMLVMLVALIGLITPWITTMVKSFKSFNMVSLLNPKSDVPIIRNGNELNINRHVDCVYMITLPQRRDRVKKFLKTHAIDAIIVDAITAEMVDIVWLHNIADYATTVSLPRVLCHASHIATLERFLQSPHQTCLIFEDDVVTTPERLHRFNHDFRSMMSSLPSSFDIFYLGYCWDYCNKRISIANSPLLVKPFIPKCRHAYVVSRMGAEKIIRHCTPLHSLPGDIIIGLAVKNNILNGYAARHPLFTQDRKQLGSSLGNHDSIRPCW